MYRQLIQLFCVEGFQQRDHQTFEGTEILWANCMKNRTLTFKTAAPHAPELPLIGKRVLLACMHALSFLKNRDHMKERRLMN